MPSSVRLAALFAAPLACLGCSGQPLSLSNSLVTSASSVARGSTTPQSHFTAGEYVRVLVYVAWPDVTQSGGDHHVDWNWYRGPLLVSHFHTNRLRFNSSPAELSTQRAAAALGPGDYRVDTLVDDKVLSSNTFAIVTGGGDHAEQAVCDVPADPQQPSLKLQPISRSARGPIYPPDAQEHEVPGCAVIRIAIDGKGVPSDVAVVSEHPAGWGFADSAATMVRTARYPSDHGGWYTYLNITFRLDANTPQKTAAPG